MNDQTKIEADPNVALIGALAKALPALGAVHKNKANPHFKSNYADLAAVLQSLAPLAEHGVWFRQVPVETESGVAYETFYIHSDGGELSAGVTTVPVDRNNAQGYGSAQTYCRRYAIMAAFGLAADDDDGNAAAKAPPKQREQQSRPAPVMSDDQYTHIQTLMEGAKVTAKQFCQKYDCPSVKALPASQYDDAVKSLSDRIKELADKAKQTEPA